MGNRIIKESIHTSKSVNGLSDFQFRLWVYLITYVDDYGRGSADAELLKGFLFPRRKGITDKQIARGLSDLATAGMIKLYEVDGESFLQFPNWENHQRVRNKVSKFPSPEEDAALDSNSRSIDSDSPQVAARIQNPESRIQNTNPETPYSPPAGGDANERTEKRANTDASFDAFWAAYPRKVGKEAARKAFTKAKVDLGTMLSAIEVQKQSAQWQKEGGRFVPSPATWLNQGRWSDELPKNTASGSETGNYFLKLLEEERNG